MSIYVYIIYPRKMPTKQKRFKFLSDLSQVQHVDAARPSDPFFHTFPMPLENTEMA